MRRLKFIQWGCACLFPVCGWFGFLSLYRVVGCYTITNVHGVAAFDFSTVSGCDQLVVVPTHTLNRWNNWPPDDWCSWPSTGCCCSTHIGKVDHSSLSAVISMAQADPNLCVRMKVSLKHKVSCGRVGGGGSVALAQEQTRPTDRGHEIYLSIAMLIATNKQIPLQ